MKCTMSGCENPALVSYSGNWICGDCMAKYEKAKRDNTKRDMEAVLNDA
jgi:hypothetical protein